MRNTFIVIILSFFFATTSFASVNSLNIKGKIVSFDQKIVTIEIAGESYKFNREKLGKDFTSLKTGDAVEISIDKESAKK